MDKRYRTRKELHDWVRNNLTEEELDKTRGASVGSWLTFHMDPLQSQEKTIPIFDPEKNEIVPLSSFPTTFKAQYLGQNDFGQPILANIPTHIKLLQDLRDNPIFAGSNLRTAAQYLSAEAPFQARRVVETEWVGVGTDIQEAVRKNFGKKGQYSVEFVKGKITADPNLSIDSILSAKPKAGEAGYDPNLGGVDYDSLGQRVQPDYMVQTRIVKFANGKVQIAMNPNAIKIFKIDADGDAIVIPVLVRTDAHGNKVYMGGTLIKFPLAGPTGQVQIVSPTSQQLGVQVASRIVPATEAQWKPGKRVIDRISNIKGQIIGVGDPGGAQNVLTIRNMFLGAVAFKQLPKEVQEELSANPSLLAEWMATMNYEVLPQHKQVLEKIVTQISKGQVDLRSFPELQHLISVNKIDKVMRVATKGVKYLGADEITYLASLAVTDQDSFLKHMSGVVTGTNVPNIGWEAKKMPYSPIKYHRLNPIKEEGDDVFSYLSNPYRDINGKGVGLIETQSWSYTRGDQAMEMMAVNLMDPEGKRAALIGGVDTINNVEDTVIFTPTIYRLQGKQVILNPSQYLSMELRQQLGDKIRMSDGRYIGEATGKYSLANAIRDPLIRRQIAEANDMSVDNLLKLLRREPDKYSQLLFQYDLSRNRGFYPMLRQAMMDIAANQGMSSSVFRDKTTGQIRMASAEMQRMSRFVNISHGYISNDEDRLLPIVLDTMQKFGLADVADPRGKGSIVRSMWKDTDTAWNLINAAKYYKSIKQAGVASTAEEWVMIGQFSGMEGTIEQLAKNYRDLLSQGKITPDDFNRKMQEIKQTIGEDTAITTGTGRKNWHRTLRESPITGYTFETKPAGVASVAEEVEIDGEITTRWRVSLEDAIKADILPERVKIASPELAKVESAIIPDLEITANVNGENINISHFVHMNAVSHEGNALLLEAGRQAGIDDGTVLELLKSERGRSELIRQLSTAKDVKFKVAGATIGGNQQNFLVVKMNESIPMRYNVSPEERTMDIITDNPDVLKFSGPSQANPIKAQLSEVFLSMLPSSQVDREGFRHDLFTSERTINKVKELFPEEMLVGRRELERLVYGAAAIAEGNTKEAVTISADLMKAAATAELEGMNEVLFGFANRMNTNWDNLAELGEEVIKRIR